MINIGYYGETLKKCVKCDAEKFLSSFKKNKRRKDGTESFCKSCFNLKENSNPKTIERANNYYSSNRNTCLLRMKLRLSSKSEEEIQEHKIYQKNYQQKNKIRIRKIAREREKKLRDADPKFKIEKNLRRRIYHIIKDGQRAGSAVRDLGCSSEFAKHHLESQFTEGMSWGNYGKNIGQWSIDHIIALSVVDLTDREQFLKVCHYTNLRPLWNKDQCKIYHKEQKFFDILKHKSPST